jgi:hypothetical protein
MPELTPQSTTPPAVDPFAWEDREGFRETLLLHFTRPGDADAMRHFGAMLYDCAIECASSWPAWPDTTTRTELRAAAADLRHLEGFLAAVGQEHAVSSLPWQDARLSRFAARQAAEVARIAHRIEQELAQWAGEAEGA